jgi:hypothetical protein
MVEGVNRLITLSRRDKAKTHNTGLPGTTTISRQRKKDETKRKVNNYRWQIKRIIIVILNSDVTKSIQTGYSAASVRLVTHTRTHDAQHS